MRSIRALQKLDGLLVALELEPLIVAREFDFVARVQHARERCFRRVSVAITGAPRMRALAIGSHTGGAHGGHGQKEKKGVAVQHGVRSQARIGSR